MAPLAAYSARSGSAAEIHLLLLPGEDFQTPVMHDLVECLLENVRLVKSMV